MGGYDNDYGQFPFGGNEVDFYSGLPVAGHQIRAIDYNFTGTNITDSSGNMLFTTNGVIVLNNVNDTMDRPYASWLLSPSQYSVQFKDIGLRLWQGTLILPHPDSANVYFLFHQTLDGYVNNMSSMPYSKTVYYSRIDMSYNSGEGKIVDMMQRMIPTDSTFSIVGLTACRHGNGKDWWILSKGLHSDVFYYYILSPTGPYFSHQQSISFHTGGNQYCFSPDGTKLGSYGTTDDFEIFDFDRCTGLLSNFRHVAINDSMIGAGAAFSPNSQFLYGSSVNYLYQIDATSNQPDTTLKTVAIWDSTYSPNPPFAARFFIQQLADDGKIYISTGNGTLVMHTIESPDLADTICNVQQHSITLPSYNGGTIPNFPNYNLGPLIGSPCDTLVGIHELYDKNINLTIQPNPSSGKFEVNYELPQNERGGIEVVNILGEVVYSNHLPQWSTIHRMNLNVSSGLYQIVITTSKSRESTKILIQ
jgi:Secretion system C-terminal sorting domain